MDEPAKDEWHEALLDARDLIWDALKKFDEIDWEDPGGRDLEELQSALHDVQLLAHKVVDGIECFDEMNDEKFLDSYSKDWLQEATVICALMEKLPTGPVLTEGAYQWTIRDMKPPPLRMPSEYDDFKDGPAGEFTVGCNTQEVYIEIRPMGNLRPDR